MRYLRVLLSSLTLCALLSCGSEQPPAAAPPSIPQGPAPATAEVGAKGLRFAPEQVTVAPGGTVTWRWDVSIAHNAVREGAAGDGFKSPIFKQGEFSHTFPEPGTFRYECTLHTGMEGTVTVR